MPIDTSHEMTIKIQNEAKEKLRRGTNMHTVLTEKQKLTAMAMKYYQGLHWEVKAGDYYTSSRDDLELYRVVSVDENYIVSTEYCNNPGVLSEWNLEDFTTTGFGVNRVYVPDIIFTIE